jgi:hypothetical protein
MVGQMANMVPGSMCRFHPKDRSPFERWTFQVRRGELFVLSAWNLLHWCNHRGLKKC